MAARSPSGSSSTPNVQIRKLSRGNRQKIGVVAAFMGTESLLILDEPTSGLDPLMQREFLGLVSEARRDRPDGVPLVAQPAEVERSCDRVGIMREGRLVEVSGIADLVDLRVRTVRLVLDAPPPADLRPPERGDRVLRTAEVNLFVRGDLNPLLGTTGGLRVRDLPVEPPDVEDVFMRYYAEAASPTAYGGGTVNPSSST